MDFTTMLASIATVITLFYFLHDRRDAANVAAWTLLHTYLHEDRGKPADVAQISALATLIDNGVDFINADLSRVVVMHARLRNMQGGEANFSGARMILTDLAGGSFVAANLDGARFEECTCNDISFDRARLTGAVFSGNFLRADFTYADISDATFF